MSGQTHRKKDGQRTEKRTRRRTSGHLGQPVLSSVTRSRGNDVSSFTDGEVAGADHAHDTAGRLKAKSPMSEPKRRRIPRP